MDRAAVEAALRALKCEFGIRDGVAKLLIEGRGDKLRRVVPHLDLVGPFAEVWSTDTELGPAGLAAITRSSRLQKLAAAKTGLTDAALASLAGQDRLTYLALDGNDVTDAGVAQLSVMPSLEFLVLSDTGVSGAVIPLLAKRAPNLRTLKLYGCSTLSSVPPCPPGWGLREFDLGATKVTDASAAPLATYRSLTHLSLHFSGVGDGIVAGVQRLAELIDLSLNQTNVTDDGLLALKNALPRCRISANWNGVRKRLRRNVDGRPTGT